MRLGKLDPVLGCLRVSPLHNFHFPTDIRFVPPQQYTAYSFQCEFRDNFKHSPISSQVHATISIYIFQPPWCMRTRSFEKKKKKIEWGGGQGSFEKSLKTPTSHAMPTDIHHRRQSPHEGNGRSSQAVEQHFVRNAKTSKERRGETLFNFFQRKL